jgi:hypothetical protein
VTNYHFRIKSDKKPDGTKIGAAEHAEYIDREGKYANIDEKELSKISYNSVITGKHPIEHLPKKELLLYKSPFGIIKQDAEGIKISNGASIQTVAIAMAVAQSIYGKTIEVRGHTKFKAKALVASNTLDFPIHFATETMEKAYIDMREEKENERNEFEANGGTYQSFDRDLGFEPGTNYNGFEANRGRGRDRRNILQPNTARDTLQTLAQGGFCLPTLRGSTMVLPGEKTGMLLSRNEQRQLRNKRRGAAHHTLRWDISQVKKQEVNHVAGAIMVNIQKQLDNVFASSHVQYINRESAFKQRGGCLYKAHHLPKWAKDSPKKFFEMADRYERANGVRYKEIEFALPNELALGEQREIIDTFIKHHVKDFYYAYAIHDKIGAMSNGERHPHVHLMISPREIDCIENQHERSPQLFFKKADNQAPERGGCPKADKWIGKSRAAYLAMMRENFAQIQNTILAKYNIPARVDHRSLKARRQEALAEGNIFLADLLNRLPEESVGPTALLEKDNILVRQQKCLRSLNQNREIKIFAKNLLWAGIHETEIKHELAKNKQQLTETLQGINEHERKSIDDDFVKIKRLQEDAQNLLSIAVWNHTAIETAEIERMTPAEREDWQDFKQILAERVRWQDFKNGLHIPELYQTDEIEAFHLLRPEIDKQLALLTEQIQDASPKIKSIFARLQEPAMKRKIQKRAGNILFENKSIQQKLQTLNTAYAKAIAIINQQLRDIRPPDDDEPCYTARQVANELTDSLKDMESQADTMQKEISKTQKEVFSYRRALAMAKNVFVNGEYKKLRTAEKQLRKKELQLSPKELKIQQDRISAWRERLDKQCSGPRAQAKIKSIAAGILQKNAPKAAECQKLMQEHSKIKTYIAKTQSQISTVSAQSAKDSGKTIRYKLAQPATMPPPRIVASKIAAAISGDKVLAQLVARSKPNTPDDWELMSEAEKEDARNVTDTLSR